MLIFLKDSNLGTGWDGWSSSVAKASVTDGSQGIWKNLRQKPVLPSRWTMFSLITMISMMPLLIVLAASLLQILLIFSCWINFEPFVNTKIWLSWYIYKFQYFFIDFHNFSLFFLLFYGQDLWNPTLLRVSSEHGLQQQLTGGARRADGAWRCGDFDRFGMKILQTKKSSIFQHLHMFFFFLHKVFSQTFFS